MLDLALIFPEPFFGGATKSQPSNSSHGAATDIIWDTQGNKGETDMPTATLVNRYLTAFYSGDFPAAGELVADEFQFKGPFAEATSKEAYFTSAARLSRVVKGHRLIRQWESNGEVCSIIDIDLETPLGKGTVTICEWNTVEDGLLRSGRVILDTAAFRALMPPQ